MTSNYLQKWQQSINPKLLERLHNRLTKPGMINHGMAQKIIERSPDMLNRLPLLAQQMQRWSTTIDLESESTPIVYVQNQNQSSQAVAKPTINFTFTASKINHNNQQIPLQETHLQNPRSQLAVTPDNSLPNLAFKTENPAINSLEEAPYSAQSLILSNTLPISSDIANFSIPRQLDGESSSLSLPVVKANAEILPENTSLTTNQSLPLVEQISPPTIQKKPLAHLESSSVGELTIQRKSDSSSASSLSLPVVKANAEILPENTSLTTNQSLPLVEQISSPTIQKQPLNKLESSSFSEFNIQRKLDNESSSLSLPVVKANSETLPEKTSLSTNQELPLVAQISSPTIQKQPLDKLESSSFSEFPIQPKLDNESSSLSLPMVKANSETLPEKTSLTANQELPLVAQISSPTIQKKPLAHLESSSVGEFPIQRKSDSSSASSLSLPVVKANSEKLPEKTSLTTNQELPLVAQISSPTIQKKPLAHLESSSVGELTIQRKSDSSSASSLSLSVVKANSETLPEKTSLTANQELPLVAQISSPTIQKKPLDKLESSSFSELNIQRKLDNESSSLSLSVVKANSEILPRNTSLTANQSLPLVAQISSPTIQKKPLAHLESSSVGEFPIQRKLDSGSASSLSLAVVKANSETLAQNTSLTANQSLPLVEQISSPTIQKKPLTNLETSSVEEFPIQRKLDNNSSSNLSLPVVKANAETLPENTSLTTNQSLPLVEQISSSTIQKKPLAHLESSSVGELTIQRKSDSSSASSLSLPVVKADSEILTEKTSLTTNQSLPLVEQISSPTIQKKPLANIETSSVGELTIQRKLDSGSASSLSLPVVKANSETLPQNTSLSANQEIPLLPQNTSLNINSELPLVSPLYQPSISAKLQEIPLVNNLSPAAETLEHHINDETSIDNYIKPINQKLESKNIAGFESGDKSNNLNANQPLLLLRRFSENKFSNINEQIENIRQNHTDNERLYLPIVQVEREPESLDFEPLILANLSAIKQNKDLIDSKLNHQSNLSRTANDKGSSFTHQPTSIAHNNASPPTTITANSSINYHPPPVNLTNQSSVLGVNTQPQINIDALVEKVERRIMRRLVVESERRGKQKWR
ncbi:hypothetical protein IQ278_14680 [Tolypothrix sp. LEGE 11397]|uniref:hypothetical protein n=1 Tax=Tolypothrix sp. LEGE 11397 TaxID=2777971 RepID=UPI001880FD24|nr:hypothetical protein [Tolypothrix sp. LEGE 11397]MBE9083357.1 hypothetical protein [Tolypothrix sp. LEGE 11397]